MQATASQPLSRTSPLVLSTLLAAVALALAGVMLALYLVAALNWYAQPFLGFLPTRALEVSDARSLTGQRWPALYQGLKPGDRIVRLDGEPLDVLPLEERLERFNAILAQHTLGDRVPISFRRDYLANPEKPIGATCTEVQDAVNLWQCGMVIRLVSMPALDFVLYFVVGWLAAAMLWGVALVVWWRRRTDFHAHMLALVAATFVVFMAGHFDRYSTDRYTWLWLTVTALSGGLLLNFGGEFPFRFASLQHTPAWRWAVLVVALSLGTASAALYLSDEPYLHRAAITLALGAQLVGGVGLLGMMYWRRVRSASPVVRNQSTIIIMGLVPALLPVAAWFGSLVVSGHPSTVMLPFVEAFPLFLPLSATYAVLQYRLVDTDRVITQSLLYAGLLALLTLSYFLVVAGITYVIGASMQETALNPAFIVAAIFGVAVAFMPLRNALQRRIENTYFRARRTYQGYLEQFSSEVTTAATLSDVMRLVQETLENALAPQHVTLFVRRPETNEYRALPDPESGERPTDIVFGAESGLVRYLRERSTMLYLEERRPLPLDVVSDRARLAVLGAPLIVGLRGQKALAGFLCVGPRRSGFPYLHEDLRFVDSLSDQIALAVERAQAAEDLEHRARVQAVLSQVSRALNFAIDLDTLFELIYAQTLRVISADCFYIVLRNPNLDELYYVFYSEGDERISAMEGKRWRMGRDLISTIVRTQQTIRTDDFVRESLLRDPHNPPSQTHLKAWMGVPLLSDTGEGALGAMIVASTQQGHIFTDEQQDIFWDIANLAVSAINRLQLLDQAQQRARQLAAINEIARELSAELGDVDRLLHKITENAVRILGAEAGSLLLVDEESGDLEFHVVVGGGGEELVGKRLPAGTGLAGATVQRGAPIIVNDPVRDSRWYGEIVEEGSDGRSSAQDDGQKEGFHTGTILSVPLMVGGRAIGVLQCLNKRDGGIFVPEDADLLQTFAGQAAVAIENARLFDMTDQQLALRVQELDTMQRIDQALNRTLDLRSVVDITMDWALRKSGATAGALLMRDREAGTLKVVASYGYPQDSPLDEEGVTLPDDEGVLGRVVRSAQPSLITDVSIDPDYSETLPGCVAQLIAPLISADEVIGVILLESDREGELTLLDLDFVVRLAEHATPAILNAQLFQELQRANDAKSEFVSFVAHELKNPMTSMKGYTDLLLKGVVGAVNEQQARFLQTIYNNVVRMETLVSDLNDLTKQQTNNLRLELTTLDFRNVVTETLRAQQRLIEEKGQTLVVDVPEDLPPVRGDQNRLIQIMTNLVSNANKYTPQGGTITIFAEATRNHWDPQGPPEVLHCYVQDTGIGMSEEDLRKLFTPYFRSENPKTREQPGTGLGLTITKGLVELHGGKIWVESTLNEGTTFHFTIPLATEEEAEQAAPSA